MVKTGECLCFSWNEVRPVVKHSVPAASGYELQVLVEETDRREEYSGPTGLFVTSSYSIYLMHVSMQYFENCLYVSWFVSYVFTIIYM